MIAHSFWNNGSALSSLADNHSGTWTPVGTRQSGAGGLAGWSFQSFYCASSTTGVTTITATASTAVHVALCVAEYSGFTGTPTLDTFDYRVGSSSDGQTRATDIVTTTVSVAVASLGVFPAPGISSISSPFTDLAAGGYDLWDFCGIGHRLLTSTQASLNATYTLVSNTDDISGLVVIGDVAAAPVTHHLGDASPTTLIILSH